MHTHADTANTNTHHIPHSPTHALEATIAVGVIPKCVQKSKIKSHKGK